MKALWVGFVLAICILGTCGSLPGFPTPQGCAIDSSTVRNWIETPVGFPKGSWHPEGSSFVEKQIYRAGDRFALGVVYAYGLKDLIDPDRLDRVLSLIRLSFSKPELIVHKEDENPAVTMVLLFALEHECQDGQWREKIIDTERYVSSQAKGYHSSRTE